MVPNDLDPGKWWEIANGPNKWGLIIEGLGQRQVKSFHILEHEDRRAHCSWDCGVIIVNVGLAESEVVGGEEWTFAAIFLMMDGLAETWEEFVEGQYSTTSRTGWCKRVSPEKEHEMRRVLAMRHRSA